MFKMILSVLAALSIGSFAYADHHEDAAAGGDEMTESATAHEGEEAPAPTKETAKAAKKATKKMAKKGMKKETKKEGDTH